jgi:hypothetical protein
MPDQEEDPYFTAYFYYISPTKGTFCYEYFDIENAIKNPEALAIYLLGNTVNYLDSPKCYCNDAKYLHRRRRGYAIVAVEDGQFIGNNPIQFILAERSNGCDDGVGDPADYTFSYLSSVDVEFGGRSASIVIYTNDMINYDGEVLGEKEWETFTIGNTSLRINSMDSNLLLGDSGGTNMGPPAPPPNGMYAL